jgi:5-methylcytosine-specific restriction endonuclease McrA
MTANTLLLDCGYQPVAVISWQRAVCLLTRNKIEVIEEYEDRELRSRTWVIKMPAVVRLLRAFRRHKKKVKFSRYNILARDRWKCQYCDDRLSLHDATYDHVVPRSKGGQTHWENIVSCCGDCNLKKRNRTPQEAGMRLRKPPTRPDWVPVFMIVTKGTIPEQWTSYLYWMTELESS